MLSYSIHQMALISRGTGCGKRSSNSLLSDISVMSLLSHLTRLVTPRLLSWMVTVTASWSWASGRLALDFFSLSIWFYLLSLSCLNQYFHWRWPGCFEIWVSNRVFRSGIFGFKNIRLLFLVVLDIIWVSRGVQRMTFLKDQKLSLYWGKGLTFSSGINDYHDYYLNHWFLSIKDLFQGIFSCFASFVLFSEEINLMAKVELHPMKTTDPILVEF